MSLLLAVAQILVSIMGTTQADSLACWENIGDVPAPRYQCTIEHNGLVAWAWTNGNDGVSIAFTTAPVEMPTATEVEQDAFVKFTAAVVDDGDTQNDWVTHLAEDRQATAVAIGNVIAAAFGERQVAGQELVLFLQAGAEDEPWLAGLPQAQEDAARLAASFWVSINHVWG